MFKLLRRLFGSGPQNTPPAVQPDCTDGEPRRESPVDSKVREMIERALPILQRSRELDDYAVIEALVADGSDRADAFEIIVFVPLAFSRYLLRQSGINFPRAYRLFIGGQTRLKLLGKEPVYRAAMELASRQVGGTLDYTAIAGRCAEFKMINAALQDGSQLRDLMVAEPMVIAPPP